MKGNSITSDNISPLIFSLLDGANVAYYGNGVVNYHQVLLMVSTLESMGENPLVVMPQKYVRDKFYLRRK